MESLTCPQCKSETPNEYNFCVACDVQIKCLNRECGKILVPGKAFCFGCGQAVMKISEPQVTSNKYVRTVTQQSKNYSEHTEFHASDQAIHDLAPFIGGQITSPQRSAYEIRSVSKFSTPSKTLPPIPPENGDADIARIDANEPESIKEKVGSSTKSTGGAARHFSRDGEILVAGTKDYKGKTWADQQRNFILLYIGGYNQVFGKPAPKDSVKSAGEKSGIADVNNFSRYLAKAVCQFCSELSQGLQLNDAGEKEITRIISAIDDEMLPAGYEYWSRPSSDPAKRQRISSDDKTKLQEWAKEDVPLGKLDISSISIARDYALVSLWIVTIYLKKTEAITWNIAYHFFKEKYTTISSSAETFSAAMRKQTNEKYFRQTDDRRFFLSSEGQKQVNLWISGEATPVTKEEK